jgi:hypothetical protein
MSDDLILKKLIEMQERFDFLLGRVDELEQLLNRMIELRRAIETGVPPPPAPRVN